MLEPTCEISEYLSRCPDIEELNAEFLNLFQKTVQHYKATGEWLGLAVSDEMHSAISSQWENQRRAKYERVHEKAGALISELERRIADDPSAPVERDGTHRQLRKLYHELVDLMVARNLYPLEFERCADVLRDLYVQFQTLSFQLRRYKSYENATIKLVHAEETRARGFPMGEQWKLAFLYVDALSHATRDTGIQFLYGIPTDGLMDGLGYAVEQLREMAVSNLTKCRNYWQQEEFGEDSEDIEDPIMEIDLALKAIETMRADDFKALDDLYKRRQEAEDLRLDIDDEMRDIIDRINVFSGSVR